MPHPPIIPPPAQLFVDASALIAIVDIDDANHELARRGWERLLEARATGANTGAYTNPGTQFLAWEALDERSRTDLRHEITPLVDQLDQWWLGNVVETDAFIAAIDADGHFFRQYLFATFLAMKRSGISTAFGFDPEYLNQGLSLWP